MFRKENGLILYKSKEMIKEIIWGPEISIRQVDDNQYSVSKFNLETEQYELITEPVDVIYENQEFHAENGYFEYIPKPIPPQPTQLDTIQNNQLTIMEAMADQHEENLENQIVQMDVLATIYETQLESQEGSV